MIAPGRHARAGQSRASRCASGLSDAGNDPAARTTRKAYDMLAAGLRAGFQRPAAARRADRFAADQAALASWHRACARSPAWPRSCPSPGKPGAKVAVVEVVPDHGAAGRRRPVDLIKHLRDDVIPAAEHGTTLHVYVGGSTAIFDDFAAVISEQAAAVHRGDHRPGLRAAAGRLPQPARAAHGRRA